MLPLHGEELCKARHHKVRTIIAQALWDVGFRAYEEIHSLSETSSTRRIDILAFKDKKVYSAATSSFVTCTSALVVHLDRPSPLTMLAMHS